jgi:hypothetical protein
MLELRRLLEAAKTEEGRELLESLLLELVSEGVEI